jgi:Tfp pilus assembly protein PilF
MLPVALLIVLALGCSSTKKTPTQQEAAKAKWNHTRAMVLFGLARDQYATGNFEPARKSINEALQMDPKFAQARVLSAKLAIEAGQLELADHEHAEARAIDPKDPDAQYLSGVVYQRWAQTSKACDFYAAAAELKPDELAYLLAKSEMLVAMGREEEALRTLQEKVVYFEHSAVIRDAVGQLLVQFKKYDEAADVLKQASILDGNDQMITEHLAFALLLAGKHKEAVDPFQKLLRNPDNAKRADLYLALGQCQMETDKVRDARRNFETAAQIDGQNPSVWLALTRAALQQNDVKRAELSIKRALSLDPARCETRLLMGYVRLKQGKKEEALSSFQRAAALDKRDTVSLCMVGYTLQQLGRNDEALKYFAQALKIKPGDEMAARMMASLDAN